MLPNRGGVDLLYVRGTVVHNAPARVMEAENSITLTIYSNVNWLWAFTYEYTSLPGPWIHNQDYEVTKHYTCDFSVPGCKCNCTPSFWTHLWSSCLANVSQLYAGSDITNCLTYVYTCYSCMTGYADIGGVKLILSCAKTYHIF